MDSIRGPITSEGALVDIQVGLSAPVVQGLRASGRPVLQALNARALIDPGAEVTCLDPQILTPLAAAGAALQRVVFANLPSLGGLVASPMYAVSLTVVHPSGTARANLTVRNLPVLEQPLGLLGYQALLGRDVLERCLVVYDGPGRCFTLAF